MNNYIFGNPKIRYGNVWAFTSYLILFAKRNKLNEIHISQKTKRLSWIREIWDCLETENIKLQVVDKPINMNKRYGVPEHKEPYVKTKIQWKNNLYKKICYQLETNNCNRHPEKLFKGNKNELIHNCNKLGIQTIPLGLPKTLSESILIASQCDLFMGICSGMSHVCHSVGIPILLQNWNQLDKFHPSKIFLKYNNENELLNLIKSYYAR